MALGKRDEDTLTTLAGRLARLDREITRDEAKKLAAPGRGEPYLGVMTLAAG